MYLRRCHIIGISLLVAVMPILTVAMCMAGTGEGKIKPFDALDLTINYACERTAVVDTVRKISKSVDLDNDNINDEIVIRYFNDDLSNSIRWGINAIVHGECRLEVISDDAKIDGMFSDFCTKLSYQDCKREYYFTELPKKILHVIPAGSSMFNGPNDPNNKIWFQIAVDNITAMYNKSNEDARSIAILLFSYCKTHEVVMISVPVSPIKSYGGYVWCAELDGFVQVYED